MDNKIEAHFDNITQQIINKLHTAKHSIKVAMFTITKESLFRKLCSEAKNGLDVELILDGKQLKEDKAKKLFDNIKYEIISSGMKLFLNYKSDDTFGKMHNKFCIIDGKIVITGSFNWTKTGESNSDENITIIENPKIYNDYYKNFVKLRSESSQEFGNSSATFEASSKLIQSGEKVIINWSVPNVKEVKVNNKSYPNKSQLEVSLKKSENYILAYEEEDGNEITKNLAINVIEEPKIKNFFIRNNIHVIRQGESIYLEWEVENADKIILQPFNTSVNHKDSRYIIPTQTTSYVLEVYDIFENKKAQATCQIIVNDFKVPEFNFTKVKMPIFESHFTSKIDTILLQNFNSYEILNDVLKNKIDDIPMQIIELSTQQIINNQKAFDNQLKNLLYKNLKRMTFAKIKKEILDKSQSILEQVLDKIKKNKNGK